MSARPTVSVYSAEDNSVSGQVKLPNVFTAPIRPDIVNFVHTNMAKNNRQAYGIMFQAGHLCSAESWGTGRAVSRIPRCQGGGTSRSAQGAWGNMCRGGRQFCPNKVWRKWNRKINTNQRRYAVASALAASALPSLVMARGHRVDAVAELPLVISGLTATSKTSQANKVLERIGCSADCAKVVASKKIRCGVGKMRNRRFVMRKGPLIVYSSDNGLTKGFRNLPGVDMCRVESLNLLQLAPGGHLGRLIIWTDDAFAKLNDLFSSASKTGYTLPVGQMQTGDVARIINSDEVQSVVRAAQEPTTFFSKKKNALKNVGTLAKLNPYALKARRDEAAAQKARAGSKDKVKAAQAAKAKAQLKFKAGSAKFYAGMVAEDAPEGSWLTAKYGPGTGRVVAEEEE
jgi:large subunit ribosomal protein L4e